MRSTLLVLALALPLAAAPKEIVLDHDDIEVTEDVVVKPGTYVVIDANGDGVLHVAKDGVTIDFQGATLLGATDDVMQDAMTGIGVSLAGRKGVTVRNAQLSGLLAAIVASHCTGVTIEGCTFKRNRAMHLKSTPEAEDGADWLWPHENDDLQWRKNYGAGISLEDCAECVVRKCTARAQQNGLLLTRCSKAQVYDNDMSYLSGWGLAMYRTCDSVISHNSFDWCVRGYSHGVYARGQDSSGILVFEQSSRNVFAYNSATHGGDGFFLYAGHETTKRTGKGGCNGNLVYHNDFSCAVANGIEATFSDGNQFVDNTLEDCDYGVWGGYSYNTYIAGNTIRGSLTAGIAIEHGHDNVIEGNTFERNGRGVKLWASPNPDFDKGPYGKNQDTKSHGYKIGGNCFDDMKTAFEIADTAGGPLDENSFPGDGRPHQADPSRSRKVDPAKLSGERDAFLPAGHRRGRQYMIIDEWGPYDFSAPRVFPREVTAWDEATFHVLGPETDFEVQGASDGVVVEPARGKLPAAIKVHRKDASRPSYLPFSFNVSIAGAKQAIGVKGAILSATWDVAFFAWTKDPREDAAAWKTLIGGTPARKETLAKLAFAWGGGGPEGMAPDHFGTVATTEMTLPAGKYAVKTTSDDGVRVWIDGKPVIDNWTWHGPTEDKATVDLVEGKHAIRVEHFEIDGFSVLSFAIDRAKE